MHDTDIDIMDMIQYGTRDSLNQIFHKMRHDMTQIIIKMSQ